MALYGKIVTFFIFTFTICAAESDFPLITCKRNTPKYNSCLRNAIRKSWPLLVHGLPEFGIPSLDPLFYPYQKHFLDFDIMRGEMIGLNVTIKGLTDIRFLAVRPYILDDGFRLEVDIEIPKIAVSGLNKLNGTVQNFKINNKGYLHLILENIKDTWDISGPVTDDKWTIAHFHIRPTIGKLKFHSPDKFGMDENIYKVFELFLNEFWPLLYRTSATTFVKTWEVFIKDISNNFFSKVPFSKVFP